MNSCQIEAWTTLLECEKLCLSNCSCTAYAQLNISGEGSGCLHWFSDIVDIRTLPEGGQNFYLRMATVTASELQLQGIVYFHIQSYNYKLRKNDPTSN